jgi:hypothetical protein
MTAVSESVSRMQVSHAMIEVSDRLAAEFPEVPIAMIYATVGEAGEAAFSQLPNVAAYRFALEREGRIRLAQRTESPLK